MSITTNGLTVAEMAERLVLYREKHVIVPQEAGADWTPDPFLVCAHDSIRVFPRSNGTWYHDHTEIRALDEGTPALAQVAAYGRIRERRAGR